MLSPGKRGSKGNPQVFVFVDMRNGGAGKKRGERTGKRGRPVRDEYIFGFRWIRG